jgi:hypothetical protein
MPVYVWLYASALEWLYASVCMAQCQRFDMALWQHIDMALCQQHGVKMLSPIDAPSILRMV